LYALRALGFGAGEAFSGPVEETVDCYTRAIRARQSHGTRMARTPSPASPMEACARSTMEVLEAEGERLDFIRQTPHISERMHTCAPFSPAMVWTGAAE